MQTWSQSEMKVIAVNGSPRKAWNTATMLEKALEGAASQGAETELIHLYDLDFKGCISCFACKKRGGKSYGRCSVKDDLTPVYAEITEADALILGSPIYFGEVSGALRSFMERLLFPYLVYAVPRKSLFPRAIRTGLITTMNATAEMAQNLGYDRLVGTIEGYMRMIFGHAESIMSYDTYQFKDYAKMVSDCFDGGQKKKRRAEVFPQDCQKAYALGVRFAEAPGSRAALGSG
jgi:multimeric flavodoxin WrbA